MSLTPLMEAARDGDLDRVRENLGEAGKQDEDGRTALMWAASNGRLECAKLLLSEIGRKTTKYGEITLNGTTFTFFPGTTALMMAAKNGHTNIIPLLEKEMGMKDKGGWTALMWAAGNGRLECAKLLLSEIGMQTTKNGQITLNGATFYFNSGATALMMAARRGHINLIPLLEKEIGMQDERGWTALIHAAQNGHLSCAQLLLSEAGKQSTREWYVFPPGTTALMMAARDGYSNLIPLLEKEIGMQDENGWTALMYAAENGHANCIPLLENEIGMQANDGKTALMLAARNGKTDCARLLLSEAGIQSTGEWWTYPPGTTALLMALQNGRVECARLLADEATVRDEDGQLHIERIRRLVWKGGTDSTLAKTYRAVADDLEAVVMQQLLKKLAPHHITPLLPPIDRLFKDMDIQELGEAIWSALFCKPGALEALDDIFCEIEDKMVDACIVCFARQKDTVLLPCRHFVICEDCADQIEHRCPYCRTDVDEAIVIEYPEETSL